MRKSKKILIGSSLILLNVFLLVGFFIVRDATSLNNFNKEIDEISELDITTDRFNRKIKSNGSYAIVEKSIKSYFDAFPVGIDEITLLVDDQEFKTILSYDNYEKDGPDFVKSLSYIENSKEEFNKKIDSLIEMTSTSYIDNYIKDKTSKKYYISLYEEVMNDSRFVVKIHQLEELLKKTKVRVNNLYDNSLDVLNFLNSYKDSWELEDGEIKFKTEALFNTYSSMISKVKNGE